MKYLACVSLAIAFFATAIIAADDPIVLAISSYAFEKQYTVNITKKDFDKSPKWKEDAENPPISARKAIQLADVMKNSLVKDTDKFKWAFSSASLTPTMTDNTKWYWSIYYVANFQGASIGVPHHLNLIVLMDGTVIKPEISQK